MKKELMPLPSFDDKSYYEALSIIYDHLKNAPKGSQEEVDLALWLGNIIFNFSSDSI